MILTGLEILKEHSVGKIKISDFDESKITTNSYDLSLGNRYLRYTDEVIDVHKPANYEIIEFPESGLVLKPGDFILAETEECIGSDHYVPLIHGRSGTARAGLFAHITADLIDIGSYGKSTLQLYATLPIRIYRGMRIAQVTFWKPVGAISLYEGKYQGSDGPMPSFIYRDFEKEE